VIGIVWEFRVRAERTVEFERRYAADGDWARLFRRASGFRFTSLARDAHTPGRYLTIDGWEDLASFERFKQEFAREYEELDKECEGFTVEERRIGFFEVLS
jgi:heme-degrading monooxygenase HmoA